MKNTYRIIVKVKKQYMSIDDDLKPVIKDEVTGNKKLNEITFHPVIPFEYVKKTNNIKKETLSGLYYIYIDKGFTEEKLIEINRILSSLPYFEYIEKLPETPPPPPTLLAKEFSNNTPDFTDLQDYKYGSRGDYHGIDMEYAWSLDIAGQGISIADIEWGFNFNHIDLKRDTFVELIPLSNHDNDRHGTAVAGVLYAKDNDFGVTGMVHDADVFYGVTEFTEGVWTRPTNIIIGLEELKAGDVFLFEIQESNGKPADYNKAVWDITKAATDAGIIIVATAGNGGLNLDSVEFEEYRNLGDNGAIMVGAGTKIGRDRCDFSNYGNMVHVQGWGDGTVVTTGYGTLYNGAPLGDNNYTNDFAGTSSAGPIVASAVVAIQSWFKRETNNVLYPLEMRKLLIETGIPQGNAQYGHIGPLPNIRNAIEKLEASIVYFDVINSEDIDADNINDNLKEHDVVVINLYNGEWSENIHIPQASLFNRDKRIFINNHAIYNTNVYFNYSVTPIALDSDESLSLVSNGDEWIIRETDN